MDRITLRQRLAEIAFAAELPGAVLDEIATAAAPADFVAGTVIFREGTIDRNLYLLNSGQVALEMLVPGRGRVRLLSLGPGDMLAWSALLGEGRMTATAIATEDTETIAIDADRLLEICTANPQVGFEVMRRMSLALSKRLLATRLQLLDLYSTEPLLYRE
jgi:CRP-like cAMP-binding protein